MAMNEYQKQVHDNGGQHPTPKKSGDPRKMVDYRRRTQYDDSLVTPTNTPDPGASSALAGGPAPSSLAGDTSNGPTNLPPEVAQQVSGPNATPQTQAAYQAGLQHGAKAVVTTAMQRASSTPPPVDNGSKNLLPVSPNLSPFATLLSGALSALKGAPSQQAAMSPQAVIGSILAGGNGTTPANVNVPGVSTPPQSYDASGGPPQPQSSGPGANEQAVQAQIDAQNRQNNLTPAQKLEQAQGFKGKLAVIGGDLARGFGQGIARAGDPEGVAALTAQQTAQKAQIFQSQLAQLDHARLIDQDNAKAQSDYYKGQQTSAEAHEKNGNMPLGTITASPGVSLQDGISNFIQTHPHGKGDNTNYDFVHQRDSNGNDQVIVYKNDDTSMLTGNQTATKLIGAGADPKDPRVTQARAAGDEPFTSVNNGNSLASQYATQSANDLHAQKMDQLKADLELQNAQLLKQTPDAAQLQTAVNGPKATSQSTQVMYKVGQDPITGETLDVTNAPASFYVDGSGNVIPQSQMKDYGPTTSAKTARETADVVQTLTNKIRAQVAAHPDYVGPVSGRANEAGSAMGVNTGGYQEFANNLKLLQSALTKMHTSRFSNAILDDMKSTLRPSMNVDQFNGGLDSIAGIARDYQNREAPMTVREWNALHPDQQQAARSSATPVSTSSQGQPVYDQKTGQQTGYWNGTKFTPLGR
jgi:hypothetical protein